MPPGETNERKMLSKFQAIQKLAPFSRWEPIQASRGKGKTPLAPFLKSLRSLLQLLNLR